MQRSDSMMWDELRKEARKVESDVDSILAAYSRLGSLVGLGSNGPDVNDAVVDAEERAGEIEKLLERLKVIHGAMAECVRGSSADLLNHTLARHNDILHEFSQEFVRIRKNVTATLQHAKLVGQSSKKAQRASAEESSDQKAMWRERGAIQSASDKADEIILQVQGTSANIQQQRATFDGMFGKVVETTQNFPLVNSILTSIQRKKSRDNLILSSVIVVCTVFLLFYWVNK